jgi:protoheme IX farnesyltransferase
VRIGSYYLLMKPGIVYGNAVHTVAGSLFAISVVGQGWLAAAAALVGTSCIIASACIVNNYGDRAIDAKMARTKRRPSVTGEIPLAHGAVMAIVLFAAGSAALLLWTNTLTWWLGVLAYISYTVIYAYAKRRSPIGTIVGTVPGALPAVAGYTAVAGAFDTTALLLGLLIVVWQMVHFYAIAIFRKSEYKNAGVPVITTKLSFEAVRTRMIGYTVVYVLVIAAMLFEGALSAVSLAMMATGALLWLLAVLKAPGTHDAWARRVFKISLLLSIVFLGSSIVAVAVG